MMTPYYGSPSREKGFKMAADILRKNKGKLIVETGCMWEPSQGCSTYWLAKLAHEVDGALISFDTNPDHITYAREAVAEFPFAAIYQRDGLDALGSNFIERKIDLLYLDAFDFEVKNPGIVSLYNLAELGAALGKMATHSAILLDDWNYGEGEWRKCKHAKELLLYRGWSLVNEDYQLLFER